MPKVSVIPWIIKKLKGAIGIVEDTDTAVHAIASGKYVMWKGTLCKTTSAIAIGDTLSTGTGGNLAVVDDGGLNDVNGNIPAVYNGLDSTSTTSALSAAQGKALNSKITTIHPTTELGTMSDLVSLINASPSGLFINCRIGATIVNKLCGVSSRQGTINAFKSSASSDYIEYTVIDTEAVVYSGFYRISKDTATYDQLALNSNKANITDALVKNGTALNLGNITSDSDLLALDYAVYQVSGKKSSYIPFQYGTLARLYSGATYNMFIGLSTGNKFYIRHANGNSSFHTDWEEVALNSKTIHTITLESGWTATTREVVKIGSICFLQTNGLTNSSTSSGWTTVGTLPDAVKPSGRVLGYLSCDASMTNGKTTIAECRVTTDKTVQIYAPQAGEKYWGGFVYFCD